MGQSLSSVQSSTNELLPPIVVQSLSCVQSSTTTAQEVEEQQRSETAQEVEELQRSEPVITTENEDQVAKSVSMNEVQPTSSVIMSENGDADGSKEPIEQAQCEDTSEQRKETSGEQAEKTPEEQTEEPLREPNEPSVASTAASALSDKEKIVVDTFLRKNKYPSVDGEKIKTSCNKKSADYPLHAAAKQNDEEAVKALLKAGADKTKLNTQKKTAFQLAKKNSPVATLLAA